MSYSFRFDKGPQMEAKFPTEQLLSYKPQETGPAADGVCDVKLLHDHCTLSGYWGPSAAVAASAEGDHISFQVTNELVGVLANVRTFGKQRQGHGTRAVLAFLEHIKLRGVYVVYLRATIQDEPWDIVPWYERLGFQRSPGEEVEEEPQMFLRWARSPKVLSR